MSIVQQLAAVVAPWADFYNNSTMAQTAVNFGHFGGMMTAGGFALAADRATLRAARGAELERPRHLVELSGIHPIVVGALAATMISGVLLFAADLEALAVAPAFWIKMMLVALLLANGWTMVRSEQALVRGDPADAGGWQRLRRAATASLVLWFAVVLAGSVLPNV